MRSALPFASILVVCATALLAACGGAIAPDPGGPVPPTPGPPVPAPVAQTVTSTSGLPMRLAVDAHHVYFATYTGGAVARAPITGGDAEVLASSGADFPFGVALDRDYVYWSCYETAKVLRKPIAGGAIETVGTASFPSDLALAPGHVYVASAGGPVDMPINGTASLLVMDGAGAESLSASGGSIVWTDFGGGLVREVGAPSLTAAPPGSLASTTLAANRTVPQRVVTDGVTVYWTEGEHDVGAVASVPIGGGDVKVLSSTQQWAVDIAVDASGVYWTDVAANTISRLAPGAASPVVIASGELAPWAIATDATSIYWSTLGDGTTPPQIRRMAK